MPKSPLLDPTSKSKTQHNLRDEILRAMTAPDWGKVETREDQALVNIRLYFQSLQKRNPALAAAFFSYVQSDEYLSGIDYRTYVGRSELTGEETTSFEEVKLPMPSEEDWERILYIYGAPDQLTDSAAAINAASAAIGTFLNTHHKEIEGPMYDQLSTAYKKLEHLDDSTDAALIGCLNTRNQNVTDLFYLRNLLPSEDLKREFLGLAQDYRNALDNTILGHRGKPQIKALTDQVEADYNDLMNYLQENQEEIGRRRSARLRRSLEQAHQLPHETNEEKFLWLKAQRDAADKVYKSISSLSPESGSSLLEHVQAYQTSLSYVTLGFSGPIQVEGLKSPATVADRAHNLNKFLDALDNLRSHGHSDEWKAMEAALKQTRELLGTMNDNSLKEPGDPAAKRKLAASLELLKKTAHNYVIHKYQPGMDRDSKDFQRMQMARELERCAEFDLLQVGPMAELENRREYISSNSALHSLKEQADALERQKDTLRSILSDMATSESGAHGFSNEYHELKNALAQLVNSGVPDQDALERNHDAAWNEYRKSQDELLRLTNFYIEHKQRHNDAGISSMEHLSQALRLRDYLTHQKNAENDDAVRDHNNRPSDIQETDSHDKELVPPVTKEEESPKITNTEDKKVKVSDTLIDQNKDEEPNINRIIEHDEEEPVPPVKEKPVPPVKDESQEAKELMQEQQVMVKEFKTDWTKSRENETLFSMPKDSHKRKSKIPRDVLITGNKQIIRECLDNNSRKKILSKNDVKHLNNRLKVMNYLDKLEKFYNDPKHMPHKTGPATKSADGYLTLPLKLDRKQDGRNSCWSCAFSILLQSRGVNLDQTLIRRYRPDIPTAVTTHVETARILNANSDTINEMGSYFSLVDKVCPNTVMKKYTFAPNQPDVPGEKTQIDQIVDRVKESLFKKHAPVAMTDGNHWVTIVGYNEKTGLFRVLDSHYKPDEVPRKDLTKEIDLVGRMKQAQNIFAREKKNISMDFVTVEDLDVIAEPDIKLGGNGEIVANPNMNPDHYPVSSDFHTTRAGIGIAAGNTFTYYPSMARNFLVPYDIQKQNTQTALKEQQLELTVRDLLTELRKTLQGSEKEEDKARGKQMDDPEFFKKMCTHAAALPEVKEFAALGLQEFCFSNDLMKEYMKFLQKKYPDKTLFTSKFQELAAVPKSAVKKGQPNARPAKVKDKTNQTSAGHSVQP